MLIDVKTKVARVIDGKTRKRTETFVVDKELFAQAEYAVMNSLIEDQNNGTVEEFEIQALKISAIKEIATQFTGDFTFIATLNDIFVDDKGNERIIKYKVLLWADSLTQANTRTLQLVHQGYEMKIEGIKQVDYEYLTEEPSVKQEENNNE